MRDFLMISMKIFLGLLTITISKPVLAKGSQKEIKNVEIWENGRPANFYKMALDLNPEICTPILTALNKPIKVEHARFTWGNYLMQSEYSIPWEDLTDTQEVNLVGRAIVDLDHNGVNEEIYVQISSQHNVINHMVYIKKNNSSSNEEFDAFNELKGEDISNLTSFYGNTDRLGLRKDPFNAELLKNHFENKSKLEQYFKRIKKILYFGTWVDVIRFEQDEKDIAKDYLLKSSNRFAGRTIDGEEYSTIPSVFVIDVQQDSAQHLQCHFESNYKFIP